MFGLGFGEVMVILVVALLVFGPERLPELAKTLGKTMAELRRSMDELRTEFRAPMQDFERSMRQPGYGDPVPPKLNQPPVDAPPPAQPQISQAAPSALGESTSTENLQVQGSMTAKELEPAQGENGTSDRKNT